MASLDDNSCGNCNCGNGDGCFVVLSLMKSTGKFRFELLGILEFDDCGLDFDCVTTSSISSV